MHKRVRTNSILTLLSTLFALVLLVPTVFAQEASSTSFLTQNPTINSGGGSGTSSNFSAQQSLDQVAGGQSTSTNFLINAGFLYFDAFAPRQQNWRWYDDISNETPTSPLEAENVSPANVGASTTVKLRVSVAEIGGVGQTNVKFKLQYATSSDFSTGAHDVAEIASCSNADAWCYADGAGVDNATISTKVLSDADACSGGVGTGCGTHNESGVSVSSATQDPSTVTEYEFTLVESVAVANTAYFFRLFDTTAGMPVVFNTGKNYPSLSSSGGTLTFSVDGLPAATVTSGTTTTIDTTSTSIPFGALLEGSSALGAQRLTVTTNASQGYQVFSYAVQGFVGATDAEIPPVSGTNNSPIGWTIGCSSSATGCYGYHTNESVLFGGSTRFAADDTFAKFSTTSLDEVAYSTGPATARSTDIVYKTEIHNQQTADSYTTNVVYIVVPTF